LKYWLNTAEITDQVSINVDSDHQSEQIPITRYGNLAQQCVIILHLPIYSHITNIMLKNTVSYYTVHIHDVIYCYYLLVSVCGQINSVTERILINQSEDFSSFLISLQTLFSVPWLYSFHNVYVFIWIHVS
jgi:hypothetical protein